MGLRHNIQLIVSRLWNIDERSSRRHRRSCHGCRDDANGPPPSSELVSSFESSESESLPPTILATNSPLEISDIVRNIISFVGRNQYRFVGGINRQFRND